MIVLIKRQCFTFKGMMTILDQQFKVTDLAIRKYYACYQRNGIAPTKGSVLEKLISDQEHETQQDFLCHRKASGDDYDRNNSYMHVWFQKKPTIKYIDFSLIINSTALSQV